jgi:hypothetical protein
MPPLTDIELDAELETFDAFDAEFDAPPAPFEPDPLDLIRNQRASITAAINAAAEAFHPTQSTAVPSWAVATDEELR